MLFGKNSFFKTRQPKKFAYRPLYWDEEKEEQDARVRLRSDGKAYHKLTTDREYFSREFRKKSNRSASNMRVLIFVILLLLMFIFFM